MDQIVAAARSATAVHVDETGRRAEGAKARLWVAAASGATASQVRRSRGAGALESLPGEGPGERRVIISDRFPTYARAPNRRLCWAHLRRDFMAMIDRAAGGEVIGRRLLDRSRWIDTWWGRLGGGSLSRSTLQPLRRRAPPLGPGHTVREGSACPCARTARVCRSLLESRAAPLDVRGGGGGGPGQQRGGASGTATRGGLAEAEPGDGKRNGGRFRGADAVGGRYLPSARP